MKFSHSLLFNAVPEWTSSYINYENLKSAIYRFEKHALTAAPAPTYTDDDTTAPPSDVDLESARLLPGSTSLAPASEGTNERIFTRLLDRELHKITEFYVEKEKELLGELATIQSDIERLEENDGAESGVDSRYRPSEADSDEEDGSEEEEDEDEAGAAERNAKKRAAAFQSVMKSRATYEAAKRLVRDRAASTGSVEAPPAIDLLGDDAVPVNGDSTASADQAAETAVADDEEEDDPNGTEMPASRPPVSPRLQPPAKVSSRRRQRSNNPTQSLGTGKSGGASSTSPGNVRRRPGRSLSISGFLDEIDGVRGLSSDGGAGFWERSGDWEVDNRIMYKRRITAVFTALSELKQFVDLNHTGFRKIIKKYDKIVSSDLRVRYMKDIVDAALPFEPASRERLQQGITALVPLYARIVTHGDQKIALVQLQAHLREHVVWERNTVWREMIGLERRGWGGTGPRAGGGNVPMVQGEKGQDQGRTHVDTPLGRFKLPGWLSGNVVAGAVAVTLFVLIINAQWFDRQEEQNCLAILVFVTIFWALEIVPLFVTSLMVPFLVVTLRVIKSTDGKETRLSAGDATKYIFGQMFSPTIMLLLGGFTLAAALSKQNIDKVLATHVLSLAGTRPRTVLLAYMLVAWFASMWISNVAAPVLCYSLIQPILRTLPSNSPFPKALILGIALASNIGGMASPISSPQNLIALEYMVPVISWLGWFAISIPVSLVSIFFIWIGLLWSYRPSRQVVSVPSANGGAATLSTAAVVINPVRVNKEKWTKQQWFVAIVTILTVVGWCVETKLAWLLGDMGIIAIFPIVMFYGSGILRKADFDHSPWSIVFLAMGGIALGKAVLSSGLLDDMDRVVEELVLGFDIWPILAVFSLLVLVIATLISHTIASVLVVPIAARIGSAMEVPHPRLLILATALICSAGMGLPISGFPNLQAINVEDDMGQRYLEPKDFFKNGIPASIIAVVVIITVGFGIMRLIGL